MLIKKDVYQNILGGLLAIMLFFAIVGAIYLLQDILIEETSILMLTVIVAVFTFVANAYYRHKETKRLASKDLLQGSLSMLEKGFEMIQGENSQPNNDRASWVSCSDLILSSQNISNKITFPEHEEIWERNKKYWQIKFYETLHPNGQALSKEHFREDIKKIRLWGYKDKAPIDLKSIAIIYDFIMDRELEEDWQNININDPKYTRVFSNLNPGVSDYFDEFHGKGAPIRI